jgi:hypothetical protein
MAALFAIGGLVGICILGYFFGAESRPEFLDPRKKLRRWI